MNYIVYYFILLKLSISIQPDKGLYEEPKHATEKFQYTGYTRKLVIVYCYYQTTCLKSSVQYSRAYFNAKGYSKTIRKLRFPFQMNYLHQGCTNPGRKAAEPTIFCTVRPNIRGPTVCNLLSCHSFGV